MKTYPTRTNGELGTQARSPRIVICGQKDDPFARVSKDMLDNPELSWKAKGILAYLIGKPRDWKLRVKDLENHSKNGEKCIRSALLELRKAGYAKLADVRDERGRLIEWVWTLSDDPIFRPDACFPHVDNPQVGNGYLTKKDCTKTELTKNESKESKETPSVDGDVLSSEFEAQWIPDQGSKEEKLRRIRPPQDFPSEREFDAFVLSEQLDGITTYRDDLYRDLCLHKWHQWKERSGVGKWVRIQDWKKYIKALDVKLTPAF